MKKKILIMMSSMGIGGVEKALLNFLHALNSDEFEVTILFVEKKGEYLKEIPKWVKVNSLKIPYLEKNMLNHGKKYTFHKTIEDRKLFLTLNLVYLVVKSKVYSYFYKNRNNYFEEIGKKVNFQKKTYDIALDFHGYASFTTYFVSEKVDADIKATWIHSSDFYQSIKRSYSYYDNYDRIFGVSQACVEEFIKVLPNQKNKCTTFYNLISEEDILKKSRTKIEDTDEYKGLKILTVGRLSIQKGYDIAITVAAKLKEKGYKFKWYIIGDGEEREFLEKMIVSNNVSDCFVLLGSSNNPYVYMKESDMYVQPSRWEGYCITLAEAKILNMPIITTDFYGAREQIVNYENGLIVECEASSILDAVINLIENPALMHKFRENLIKEKTNNLSIENEMKNFYNLVYNNG